MYNTFPERTRSSRARITSTTGVHVSRVCTHSRSTYSEPMLRRLASTDRTRFFRWLPAELRSPGRVCSVYLVPTTNRSRSDRRKSPRILSAFAIGVDVCRIEERAAGFGERVQDEPGGAFVDTPGPALAKGHRAQCEFRDPQSGRSEQPVSHIRLH